MKPEVFPHQSQIWLSDEPISSSQIAQQQQQDNQELTDNNLVDANAISGNQPSIYDPQKEEQQFMTELGEDIDAFMDNMNGQIVTTKAGYGKFSVYFVIFATVLALGIFAYSLVRLIKQCKRDKYKSYEPDFFCRADNRGESVVDHNQQLEIEQTTVEGNKHEDGTRIRNLNIHGVDP